MLVESSVEQHLLSRGLDLRRTRVIVDDEAGLAVFLLFNVSGQLVGYQQYRPGAEKSGNEPRLNRYFTRRGDEGKSKKLAVWGLETVTSDVSVVYVVEGIFDAVKLHNADRAAVAILTSNPGPLGGWLRVLGKRTIGILDNDHTASQAGGIRGSTSKSFVVPDPYKDLGDMPQDEVNDFISAIERSVKI